MSNSAVAAYFQFHRSTYTCLSCSFSRCSFLLNFETNPDFSSDFSSLMSGSFKVSSCSNSRNAVLITSLAEENRPDLICLLMNRSKYSPNNIDVFFAIGIHFDEFKDTKSWYFFQILFVPGLSNL